MTSSPQDTVWEIVARNGRVWVECSRGRIDCATLLDAERIADALKALDRGAVLRDVSDEEWAPQESLTVERLAELTREAQREWHKLSHRELVEGPDGATRFAEFLLPKLGARPSPPSDPSTVTRMQPQ